MRGPRRDTMGAMSRELSADLARAGDRLSEAVGGMASTVLGMDSERARGARLADRYEDLSARTRDEYPSLAGPAARLAELWRELDAALGRLTAQSEQVIVAGDGLADRARTMAPRPGEEL
jgi:hypothetical protein